MPAEPVRDPIPPGCALKAAASEVFPLVREVLGRGARARVTMTGSSMVPLIRSGETVELEAPPPGPLGLGTVVLVDSGGGGYLLHRVVREGAGGVVTRGDANPDAEGPHPRERVLARATGVAREGRLVALDAGLRGALGRWWVLTPVGRPLVRGYYVVRRAGGRVLRRFGLMAPVPTETGAERQGTSIANREVLQALERAFLRGTTSREAIPEGFAEWDDLARLAREEGVEGVFCDAAVLRDIAPAEWVASVQERYLRRVMENGIRLRQLSFLAGAFDEAGVPVLALKGAAFLLTIDRDPGCREMGDLDLLIKEEDCTSAVRVLEALGYTPEGTHGTTVAGTDMHLARHTGTGHLPTYQLKGDMNVELHLNALAGVGNWAAAQRDLWAGCKRVPCGTASVFVPAPLHALIHGCVHYLKHTCLGQGTSRKWLVDQARLLRAAEGAIGAEELWETAARWGVAEEVAAVLPAAAAIAGVSGPTVPEGIARRATWRRVDGSLASSATRRPYTTMLGATRELVGNRARLVYLRDLVFPDRSIMEAGHGVPAGAWIPPFYARRAVRISGKILQEVLRSMKRSVGKKG